MEAIKVLCASCNTHLFNTDTDRLDYPMAGDMFDVVFTGFFMRPSAINLDIFCPVCMAYPFFWDGSMPGAIGKNLNIIGSDGKPQVLQIKQILMGDDFRAAPALVSVNGKDEVATDPRRTPGGGFPCPSCGAKKRFHKKGCTLQSDKPATIEQIKAAKTFDGGSKPIAAPGFAPDPHLLAMEARVSSGPERGEQPTIDDLKDLERDRERRASERPDPVLRPGEGFAPQVMR